MTGALIILAVTSFIGLVLWLLDKAKRAERSERSDRSDLSDLSDLSDQSDSGNPDECCGMHAVCEKQLLSPVSPEIEYFDDEELDAFKGRAADSYSEAETEAFREVLLTLPEGEVPAWSRSLQLRGITLPTPVRDELILIVSEARSASNINS